MNVTNLMFFSTICRCGNRCKHCYNMHENIITKSKSLEEVKSIIDMLDTLAQQNKYDNVYLIFNDDPFIHKDISAIFEYLEGKKVAMPKWAISNGLALANRNDAINILSKYKQLGLDGMSFSLFGLECKHDKFVDRKGAYNNVIKAMKLLESENIDYAVNLFITSDNLDDVIHLKQEYGDGADILIFENSEQLNNKCNNLYWPKYFDVAKLNSLGLLNSPFIDQQEYKSQKDIFQMLKDDQTLLEKSKFEVTKCYTETNGDVYDTVFHTFLDWVGCLHYDQFKSIDSQKRISISTFMYETYFESNLSNLKKITAKWRDLDDRVFTPSDLIYTCFRKEIDENLDVYWYQLPLKQIRIFASSTTCWNYIPKLDVFYIKNSETEWSIKGTWGKLINEMLQGEDVMMSIVKITNGIKLSINETAEIKKQFLQLLLELCKRQFVYPCIVRCNFEGELKYEN